MNGHQHHIVTMNGHQHHIGQFEQNLDTIQVSTVDTLKRAYVIT